MSAMWRSDKRRLLALVVAGLVVGGLLLTFFLAPETIRLLRRDTTWRTMHASGIWRVGVDPSFPPFETLNNTGKPQGFDIALAEQIAAAWGLRLEIVPIGFDSLLDALQTGRVDSVISALPFDERMTKDVAYSSPYFEAGIFLAVLPDSPIQGVERLANRTIGVEWGSMADMVGRRLQKSTTGLTLKPYDTPDAALQALLTDQTVDALLIDHVTLRIAQVNGAPLVAVGAVLESNPFVIAMPITAYELQAAVEQQLTRLRTTGTISKLEEQWFVQEE